MPGSASRPEAGCSDPVYQLHVAHGRRKMLRARDRNDRFRAAMAILRQEKARMRGEWSPDAPSEFDGYEPEPTPEPRPAVAPEPRFRHPDAPFGNAKPSRPRFTEDDPRPVPEPQFHQVKPAFPTAPSPRLPSGFVLLESPTRPSSPDDESGHRACPTEYDARSHQHHSPELPMATLDRAVQIASTAHAGQVDKEQLPYILHPLRVMMLVSKPDERIAAVLHDVVEDTSVTHEDLTGEGFSEEILEAVHCLTRTASIRYVDYVIRCKENAIARAVKLADLTDNSRLDRNIIRPDRFGHDMRRISKYLVSYKFLTDQIDEDTYRRLMTDLE